MSPVEDQIAQKKNAAQVKGRLELTVSKKMKHLLLNKTG